MADGAMRFIDHIFLCVKLELKCTVKLLLWWIILAVVYCKLTERPLIQPLMCIGLDSVHLICGRAVWLGSDIAGDLDPPENKCKFIR